jgi:hypothetical protein
MGEQHRARLGVAVADNDGDEVAADAAAAAAAADDGGGPSHEGRRRGRLRRERR